MKTVVVTGASGGIGEAVVRALLDAGFAVAGLDLREGTLTHPAYTFYRTDLTSPEGVAQAAKAVAETAGCVFAVVNAAGIVKIGSLIEEDAENMQKILDVNVAATARVNRHFFPLLQKPGGRIVNFSSEYGKYCAVPFHGFYTASKHAVEAYNDALRREVRSLGVKVVAVRPGAVDTPMTHGTLPAFDRILETTEYYADAYHRLYPLMAGATKHPTPPEKIAKAVVRALLKKRPRRALKIGQDPRVKLLSCLPAPLVDLIFRIFTRRKKR